MSPPPEEMMSWVLEELGHSTAEGISISSLFESINTRLSAATHPTLDASSREALWESLVAKEDVEFVDEAERTVLRKLTYQDVLAIGFGDRRVRLRRLTTPPVSNGCNVQTPEQNVLLVSAAERASLSSNAVVTSVEEERIARASLAPSEVNAVDSLQPPEMPIPKRRGRPPKGSKTSNAKPVERKTDRRWISKPHFSTQEEADRHADLLEYDAGISRVYMNPPGSQRPGPSAEQSEEPELRQTRTKKASGSQPMIAVFKSLNLMDPHFLQNRMGTWRPAYDARMAELRIEKSKEQNSSDNRAPETSASISNPKSNNTQAGASEIPSKRKLVEILDANSIDGGPPEKRWHHEKSITPPIHAPGTEAVIEAVLPTLQDGHISSREGRDYQNSSQSQASLNLFEGQQMKLASQQSAGTLQEQSQFFPSGPPWTSESTPQYYQSQQQIVSQHQSFPINNTSQIPQPPPGYEYDVRTISLGIHDPSPLNNQRNPSSNRNTLPTVPASVVWPAQGMSRVSQAHIEAAESILRGKKVEELKAECNKHGLSTKGKKIDLVARLSDAFFELDESESTIVVQQPDVLQSDIPAMARQSSTDITVVETYAADHSASQRPLSRQSSVQPSPLAPRTSVLDRLIHNTPQTYQSPYSRTDALPGESQSSSKDKKQIETDQPKRKRGRPRKEKQSSSAVDTAVGSLSNSEQFSAPNGAIPLLPSIEHLNDLLQVPNNNFPEEPVSTPPFHSGSVTSPKASTGNEHDIPLEAHTSIPDQQSSVTPHDPSFHGTISDQHILETVQSGPVDTEQSYLEQFRRPHASTSQAPSTLQNSGQLSAQDLGYAYAASQPTQQLLPQLSSQIQPNHSHLQDHEYPQDATFQQTNFDAHMNMSNGSRSQQRNMNSQPPIMTGGQYFGVHQQGPYSNHTEQTSYSQTHYQRPSNGSIDQAQQTNPQVQGPPRGTFSLAPSRPNFPPLKATPPPSSTPQKRKQALQTSASGPTDGQSVNLQPTLQTPYKSTRMVEIEAMEESLDRYSAEARAIELPDITARLLVSYNKSVGNLVLSKDKSQLTFYALSEVSDVPSTLSLHISQVKENPNVSMKRSRPMELRLKYDDDESNEVLCRFYFGQTEPAYEAANEIRAAIVQGRIIARAAAGQTDPYELFKDEPVPNMEMLQPFSCKTCTKRFKNREGIKYHLERSNTTCNPNFDPSTKPPKPPKPVRVPKVKKTPVKRAATTGGHKRTSKRARKDDVDEEEHSAGADDAVEDTANDDTSDSASSSDDSIFAWAEKVAFVNPGTTVKSAPPTPRKVVLKKPPLKVTAEEKLLSEILESFANTAKADETTDTVVEAVLQDVVDEAVNFAATDAQIHGAATTSEDQRRQTILEDEVMLKQISKGRVKEIIMNLVNGNFGMFPGDKALWIALVGDWLKTHSRPGVIPSSRLCEEALDQLVHEEALTITNFPGQGDDDMSPNHSILVLPSITLGGTAFEKLKELMQMAYPRSYVPSTFSPPTEVLEKLQNFTLGPLIAEPRRTPKKRQDYSKFASVSLSDSDYESADTKDVSLDVTEAFQEDESDSDDEYFEAAYHTPHRESSMRRNHGRRLVNYRATGKSTQKKADIDELQENESSIDSRSISRSLVDDDSLDAISNQNTKLRTRPSTSVLGRAKAKPRAWKGGPVPLEEKERRKALQANRLMNLTPKYLQNEETGAWDQGPLHVKRGRQKNLRHQLPEPITFFQSASGAWDTRAYGHGVRPIHARPARRTDGNPNTELYLKRISESFRPVLMPSPNSVRKFLPAPPSKVLLRTGKLPGPRKRITKSKPIDAEVVDEEGSPVEPTKRRTKRRYTSAVPESEDIGQPAKRQRRRRKVAEPDVELQSLLTDNFDSDFHTSESLSPPSKPSLRVTRTATRRQQDAIQKLDTLKPRMHSEFDESPNPGLTSLPASFWIANPKAVEQSLSINEPKDSSKALSFTPPPGLKGFETVAGWEQSLPREIFTRAKPGKVVCWVTHTVDSFESSFDTEMMQLKWSDTTAFKVEDLPYEDLDDVEEIEPLVEPDRIRSLSAEPPEKCRRMAGTGKKKANHTLRRRRLTAWPSDFDGVVNKMDGVQEEFDVELAPQMAQYNRNESIMTAEEETRLIVAITVIMTLTGGVEKVVDWVLVNGLFPQYASHYLRKAWGKLLKGQRQVLENLASEFQEVFLLAYESGEVPEIDYDHLVDYPWPEVVEWATKKIYSSTKRIAKHILLPGSRKELKKLYDYKEKDSAVDKNREWFFNPSSAIYKRMEVISATAQTLPTQMPAIPKSADDIEIDDFTLARSWVRALCFTPEEDYSVEIAHEKLQILGNAIVTEAKESLVEEKIIRHQNNGRAAPGRSFEPTDVFFSALRHHVTEQQFSEAVAFKKILDAEFAEGKECVRIDYMANDGTIMCITNLQAHRRIELKAVDIPMRKFGLTDSGYETSKIPKERFRINMDIYPTSTYLFDEEIPELQEYVDPPRGGDVGEIPLWYGITDQLISDIWKRVIVGLAGVTALRAGASVASLESTFKPALDDWEIWRFMEWGVKVGLMKRCHADYEGWVTAEWWWAIVGRFCPVE